MAEPVNDHRTPSKVRLPEPDPSHPPTLIQRISSSFFAIIPVRAGRSGANPVDRPFTAPGPAPQSSIWSRLRQRENQQPLRPRLNIPTLEGPASTSCSYDSSTYYSFPSIEDAPCRLCGLFSSSRSTALVRNPNQPCAHCRSRSASSHIAIFRRPRLDNQSRRTSAVPSTIARLFEKALSTEDGPRIVSPARATSRIGNPPRTAPLPPGRIPSYNRLRLPELQPSSLSLRSSSSATNDDRPPTRRFGNYDLRPTSPRLHHISLHPGTSHHPYIHKHEVEQHLAALQAGAPSPFRLRQGDNLEDEPWHDFSATVYYGPGPSRPRTRQQRVEANNTVIIEEGRRGGLTTRLDLEDELASSGVYQRRSPNHPHPHPRPQAFPDSDTDTTLSTLTTQTPSTVRGVHLELKGGAQHAYPRLRGGGFGLELKRWLLTCSVPCSSRYGHEDDSEDDLPPARMASVGRVRAYERGGRRARMPGGVRRKERNREGSKEVVGTCSSTHQTSRPLSTSHLPSFIHNYLPKRQRDSPINQPFPPQDIPTLRGGASDSDTQRLPPTLYWLAGGKGRRPVTVKAWKQQKGQKKRFGGLLGMAVWGRKGVEGYVSSEDEESDGDAEGEVGVEVEVGSVAGSAGGERGRSRKSRSRSMRREEERAEVQGEEDGGAGAAQAEETRGEGVEGGVADGKAGA